VGAVDQQKQTRRVSGGENFLILEGFCGGFEK
jgi:hypothetical protein